MTLGQAGVSIVDVALDAAVQAAVIVLGAVLAVWLDRRRRYRHDVEEATLRLTNALSFTLTGLVSTGLDRSLWGPWHQQLNLTYELLAEIQVKSRGFAPRKHKVVLREARDLQAGIGAAHSMVVGEGTEISRTAAHELAAVPLRAAVFGQHDSLEDDASRWRDRFERL